MALKFQYNKIALQELERGLKIREAALPTIRAKEAALRLEVKRARKEVAQADAALTSARAAADQAGELWEEFDPSLVEVAEIRTEARKMAGVQYHVFQAVQFAALPVSLLSQSRWISRGVILLREVVEAQIRHRILRQQYELLEYERKKTTQKLNLYEKVQIPEHEEAIRKIKRFLEDEENLAKAAQKIVKKKKEAAQR